MINQNSIPHNIEAEQIVIGCILYDNQAINRIGDYLKPSHFYSPIHQKIYSAVINLIDKGHIANAVTLKNLFEKEEDIDGKESWQSYLNKLMVFAAPITNPMDYALIIYNLSLRRELIHIGEDIIGEAGSNEEENAKRQIEKAEQKLFNLATEGVSDSGFSHHKTFVTQAIHRIDMASRNRGSVTGISTKFTDLDKMLSGLQNSDLIILAGRPSMGKTAFAINLAFNCCEYLHEDFSKNKEKYADSSKTPSVGLFSLEMSGEQLSARMLAMISAIDATKLRSGNINDEDFKKLADAQRYLNQYPVFIDDTPALSISAVRSRARRLKRQQNLGLLVIDYLQLLRPTNDKSQNRVQEISEITQGLKAIAKELNIPVIALSQLSRAVEQREDKRPMLSDLRDSGSIEQDADIVLFIYRESYYLERKLKDNVSMEIQQRADQIKNQSEIIIAKQRNGPIGNVMLEFDPATTKFKDYLKYK